MISFGHDCPHCGVKKTGFEIKTFYENRKFNDYSIFSLLATCNSCGGSIVSDFNIFDDSYSKSEITRVGSLLRSDTHYNLLELIGTKSIKFYPDHFPEPDIPRFLPSEVEEELLTAEQLFLDSRAKKGYVKPAGNAYRTTLERALCELAENDNRAKLNKRIEKLFEEGKLTKDLKNFALHIRALSAEASHAYNDFSEDELEQLRTFTQLFLQYTFTLPAMIPEESKVDA